MDLMPMDQPVPDEELPPHPRSPEPQPLGKRRHKPTARALAMMADDLPDGPGELLGDDAQEAATATVGPAPATEEPPVPLRIRIRRLVRTAKNKFGVSRLYYGKPSGVPTPGISGHQLVADNLLAASSDTQGLESPPRSVADIIYPYPNMSTFLFNRWFWTGGKKTKGSRQALLRDVMSHPEFRMEDVVDTNFDALDEKLAQNPGGQTEESGWRSPTVRIIVPTGKKQTKAMRQDEAAPRQRRRAAVIDSDDEPEDEAPYFAGRHSAWPPLTTEVSPTFAGRCSQVMSPGTSTGIPMRNVGSNRGVLAPRNGFPATSQAQKSSYRRIVSYKIHRLRQAAACLEPLPLLCSILTLPKWLSLDKPNFGPSICISETSRSTTEGVQKKGVGILWHFYLPRASQV